MVTIHVLYMYIAMAITKRPTRKFHVIYEGCEKNENINSCRDRRHETVYRTAHSEFFAGLQITLYTSLLEQTNSKETKKRATIYSLCSTSAFIGRDWLVVRRYNVVNAFLPKLYHRPSERRNVRFSGIKLVRISVGDGNGMVHIRRCG